MYNNPHDTRSKLNILKTFIRCSRRHVNVFCTFNLGRVSTGKRLSKYTFFSKEPDNFGSDSMFLFFQWISGSFVLTLLLQQLSTIKKGITVRGWSDPIEPENNVNNRSSNILFVGKKIGDLYENGWFKG